MSENLLQSLYHNFVEESEPPREYYVILESIDANTEQLKRILNKKNKKRLQMICDNYEKVSAIESDIAFADGFNLGVQLMSEAYACRK